MVASEAHAGGGAHAEALVEGLEFGVALEGDGVAGLEEFEVGFGGWRVGPADEESLEVFRGDGVEGGGVADGHGG